MDFQALRKEYEHDGITESTLPNCPLVCFRQWLQTAIDASPGDWFEPNAMSVATADRMGAVTVRVLLLKGVTEKGIRFFTNYGSSKGQQLAVNPQAAVMFHWPYLGRQVRLEGRVEKTSRAVSEAYFHSRPRGAQIGAAISPQSQPVSSREVLEQVAREADSTYADLAVPMPEDWGGYELTADRWEFWQGRSNRLHDRIQFEKTSDGWNRVRLAP